MATLFLTCGLSGSGKTTLARQLEHERPALRLTGDVWMRKLYPELPAYAPVEIRDRVEHLQWDLALRVLQMGTDVVIDWGLSAREERDHYRTQAQDLGIKVVLCLLDPPIEMLRDRLAHRNANLPPGAYHIPPDKFDEEIRHFQRPTPQELAVFDTASA